MSFAREGLVFIGIGIVLAALALTAAVMWRSWPLWLLAYVLLILALWVAYFFRDPERSGQRGGEVVIAPADGRVVMITEVDEPAFLHGRALRISIFMNVFNVHVNRYPISGTVRFVHYNPGKFLNAATDKSSLENEQMSVGIDTGRHRTMVRQIAGLIARRIIPWARPADKLAGGQLIGLIQFGSQVDLMVPPGVAIHCKVGDVVVAGETVLARYAKKKR